VAAATTSTEEIARLVFSYAEGVDLGDFEAVSELFSHATYRAVLPDGGVSTFTGRDEVLACFQGMVITYDGIPSTKHVTTNLSVDVDEGSDGATARSYFSVLQARPDLELQVIVAGRYHDSFERREGRWRFADRLIHTDLVGDVSHHLKLNPY
jgi:3-phenylpropionate/cinnamic acid dioxygenase small subunit